MRKIFLVFLAVMGFAFSIACPARAQNTPGALEFTARITPTAARPEQVRQFMFYVLTKSYAEVVKEVEAQDILPTRQKFIDDLKISPELKKWMTTHEVMDLTEIGMDTKVSPDDIIQTPEFLLAYQHSNGGGVTRGLPRPKFTEAEKTKDPQRYDKQVQEYLATLKKFIKDNPSTVTGFELELEGVNPQRKWQQIHADHQKRVQRLAPDVAQTKYLAGKTETDLDGRATISALPPGNYWLSTLNLDANAGDTRLHWDVPIVIRSAQTTRLELTNLNAAADTRASAQ